MSESVSLTANYREMAEKDVQAIAILEAETFSDAWTSQGIYETFCQKQAFVTVAEVDGQIAGYCIIYHVMDEGEIARIAVGNKFRRRGIGRGLLDYACKSCKERQVERLLLDVRESNMGARTFYKAYGFAEDGIRKNFYEQPKEHAVLMSKTLG